MKSNLKKAALVGGLAVIVAGLGIGRYRGMVSADVVDENQETFYKALAAKVNCPQRLLEVENPETGATIKIGNDIVKVRDYSKLSVSCNGQPYDGFFRTIEKPSENQPLFSFITKYDVKIEKM